MHLHCFKTVPRLSRAEGSVVRRRLFGLSGVAILILVSGCNTGSTPSGMVTGTIQVPGATTTSTASATPTPAAPFSLLAWLVPETAFAERTEAPPPDFVPGELIVAFKPGTDVERAIATLAEDFKQDRLHSLGPLFDGGPYRLRSKAYQNSAMSREDARRDTAGLIQSV